MKALKNLGYALALVMLALALVALYLPSSVAVERRLTIAAAPETLFPLLDGAEAFARWSPWLLPGSGVRPILGGPANGVGSSLRWEGGAFPVGSGHYEVTEIDAQRRVELLLDLPLLGKTHVVPGVRADAERDEIRVNGKSIRSLLAAPRRYYAAFKPRNMVTTLSDPEGRPCIVDLMRANAAPAGVYPVGRLDWDSDGLLLLTNDGELANAIMHPRAHVPKVYRVKVKGVPSAASLDKLRRGVVIEPGVRTLPAEVQIEDVGEEAAWLLVTLHEGRRHQIKKMFERVGCPVRRLRRLSIGPLRLGRLRPGELRPPGP